ncbi:MAG TPA: hypothetical protein VHE30_06185, partial [Polyangiaceae bacterium]|nr:hypothetical protein [Polyangiaceae bacterium]
PAAAPVAPAAPAPVAPAPAPKGAAPAPATKTEAKPGVDKSAKVVLAEEPAPAAPAPAAEAPAAEEKPDEPPAPPFDKEAAKTALGAASSNAASCKKPDGPTGSGKVTVTFSPSGRVTSANVTEGPFGGTPVGGCVAKLFRAARVPAFSGDPVTVSKGFSIPE